MKTLLPIAFLLSLGLTACTAPGQITANNRVAIGVDVGDAGSSETATKSIIAATATSPAQIQWTITPGKGVTFNFMTNPGSEAVYITGYRITRQVTTTINGSSTVTNLPLVSKSNVYIPSGFNCTERSALHSCTPEDTNVRADLGLPTQMNIYLESGLGSLAQSTNAGVSQVTDIQFVGQSSTGVAVTINADGIVSEGIRAGVE